MRIASHFMHNLSWDNLRYVLSVIEAGSVSAAARRLGVNHATVLRRIAAFETSYGGAVFDKSANGYQLMPGKEKLAQANERREQEAAEYKQKLETFEKVLKTFFLLL